MRIYASRLLPSGCPLTAELDGVQLELLPLITCTAPPPDPRPPSGGLRRACAGPPTRPAVPGEEPDRSAAASVRNYLTWRFP